MTRAYPLDMFLETTEADFLAWRIKHLEDQIANIRRGAFARISKLEKQFNEMQLHLDTLKNTCKMCLEGNIEHETLMQLHKIV